jgi:hypothetical protein
LLYLMCKYSVMFSKVVLNPTPDILMPRKSAIGQVFHIISSPAASRPSIYQLSIAL